MRNPLARFLTPKKEEKPKPKGKYEVQTGQNKFKLFDERKRNLAQYETIYKQGGMVTEAINTYPLYVLTNGWRFEGEDEALVEKVESKCDELDLGNLIFQGLVDALVFGDGYQEIAPSATEDVGAVFPRPARTFETIYDEYGVITGYRQTIGEFSNMSWGNKVTIDFAPEDIIHVVLSQVGGSPTGLSMVERCLDDILRDAKIAESSAAAVERHGFPKYHVKIGQEGEDIPREDMLSIANQFQDLKQMNEFVTVRDVEIQPIDTQTMNVTEYGNWAVQRLCSALGVPEEMLGLGRGSTEATANVRLQAFYDKIGTYQKRIERIYNLQLIDKITGEPGAVKLVFNDVSPVDEELKARYIATVMGATPGDSFAIFPREWVKDQFGIDRNEYPDEEEEPLDEGLGFGEEMPAEGEEVAPDEDAFEMPGQESDEKQLASNSAACKAVISRGDKPGPACGGAEEPSKGKPKKKQDITGEKKQKPGNAQPSKTGPTGKAKNIAHDILAQRSEYKLSEESQKAVNFIKENRMKIGKSSMNHALGKSGEVVMKELFKVFKAHGYWDDVKDLSNAMLYDVKTMNPKSEHTVIMSNAVRRKIEAWEETGKEWQFPLLRVRENEDRIDVFVHTPGEDFYKLDWKNGAHYIIPAKEEEYVGYFDADNIFHKEGGKKK